MIDIKVKCRNCGTFTRIEDDELKRVYQQGGTDAFDELSDLIDRLLWNYDLETYKDLSESFKESARLLKGIKQ